MKSLLTLFLTLITFSSLVQSRDISVRTVDWPPYYAQEAKEGGPLTEIVKEAFKVKGHTINIKFIPWKRALVGVLEGKFDMLLGAYDTPERRKDYLFSGRFYEVNEYIIGLKGKVPNSYNKIADLNKHSFGLTRGYAYSKEFQEEASLQREFANDDAANIKKLMGGRVDFIVMNQGLYFDTLSKISGATKSEVVFLEPPLSTNGIYNLFSRKKDYSEQLVKDFNEGLQQLKSSGKYTEILKKHGVL